MRLKKERHELRYSARLWIPLWWTKKRFSFSKKATLKATILVIRMFSTELLLWKNQKGSTRYPIILYKWDSIADIFLWIFKKIFRFANFTKPLQTTDCKEFFCLECQMIIVFVGLGKGNCLNVIGEILQLLWEQWWNLVMI